MVGDLTRARLRADEAKCELSRAIWEAGRPGTDPEDVVRALKASILRAIVNLEEADPLLASGTLEAASQYGQLRDLEVQLAFEKGGTAAADALIDSRYAPRTDAEVPRDEPDDSDWPEGETSRRSKDRGTLPDGTGFTAYRNEFEEHGHIVRTAVMVRDDDGPPGREADPIDLVDLTVPHAAGREGC